MGRDDFSVLLLVKGRNFNPRAPYGARLPGAFSMQKFTISIHAPRMGRDPRRVRNRFLIFRFQSTRPVWGATEPLRHSFVRHVISIHAPRMGRDQRIEYSSIEGASISIHAPRMGRDGGDSCRFCKGRDFNPRAPYGARQMGDRRFRDRLIFQSTRPVWGATFRGR